MEGPVRFRCPPEFEPAPPSGPPRARGGGLGGPNTEIWLIRAPADFCPESLEGCAVPLAGGVQLQAPQAGDAAPQLYGVRGVPGGAGTPLLLAPPGPDGPLGCAPPLRGCITITQRFGPPPARRRRRTKEQPEGPQESPPGGAAPGAPPETGVTPGEAPKRKKHKGEKLR
ncbi:DNA-directed RNA polymerase I subunit RPA34 [Caloenas nicobarica]|uniref:DNA-directed RNA polymerase I subunit RPA34 n=1 Tax=Caloenas nicobarica TaxID=187106 RepID=UPI0032B732B3